ncbi:hypothetical protein [Lusitaniella coriacea]|uniref:hypothetical protein n=1 Tax=Lusitaniella coriacea TaxID=1983105 RepID=UPI003CF9C33A
MNRIKKTIYTSLLAIMLLTIISCSQNPYQGDGNLVQDKNRLYPYYLIFFSPFSLEPETISQSYHFRGVNNHKLGIRFYLLSESGRKIKFVRQHPKFIDALKIEIKLIENGEKVISMEQTSLISGGNVFYLSSGGEDIFFQFSNNAEYEMKVAVKTKENSPVPVNMQFALGVGHACPPKTCEEVLWENLVENTK